MMSLPVMGNRVLTLCHVEPTEARADAANYATNCIVTYWHSACYESETMSGSELRRLRERAGMSQADLAKEADVTTRTVIRWELGQFPIPKLAALGLRVLLSGEKKQK